MKIAVMSNITLGIVEESLKKKYEVYSPPGFNTWQMDVADSNSGLYAYEPEAIFIVVYVDKLWDVLESPEEIRTVLDDWLGTIENLRKRMLSIPIFVTDLDLEEMGCSPVSSLLDLSGMEAYWTKSIQKIDGVYVLSLKNAIREMGRSHFYSRKMWYMGNMPYSIKGAKKLSDIIMKHCEYIYADRKKCLVVDMDNTLWGGIIGEDGVEGIELSNHKEGARFYDAQKCLKRMRENGVMLAVASKNNLEDILPVFEHPFMYLKKDDFVSLKINWNSKVESLRELSEELNIGLDSFVFLDDNPNEREQMKAICPEVSVIEFPSDTAMLTSVLEDAYERYFKILRITEEDKVKTELYQQGKKRKILKTKSKNIEDYLYNLEVTADIHLMRKNEMGRVVQLLGKTNQFNTTSIRYKDKEVMELSDGETGEVITASMKDKYGDEGLTAVVILKYLQNTVVISDFVMSCRVMGRKFEDVIMKALIDWLKRTRSDIKIIQADYIKTAKNKPVENLFEYFEFKVSSVQGDPDKIGYEKHYMARIEELVLMDVEYKNIVVFEDLKC